MKEFTPKQYISFLDKMEKMKSIPRHSVTKNGITECVAAHSWRLTLMAYLLKNEIPDVNVDKVIKMCILHDIGEALTGDIPTFHKTQKDEDIEKKAIDQLLSSLPDSLYQEFSSLFIEMDALETKEARTYKALDKLEALIQHNESDISTWIPMEYEFQQTYGNDAVKGQPILEEIRAQVLADTLEKIEEEKKKIKD